MNYTAREVLEFVRENDVKFIRLAFCDIYGIQRNISIMPDGLERAFEYGISFDGSAISGFMNIEKSDLFLFPDPSTLSVLPWRPQQGRVIRFFCDVRYPDGKPFEGDGRNTLKETAEGAFDMGFTPKIGTECEFYLFERDHDGDPTNIPFDRAGYLDIAPMDKGENVRREICLTLEQMGITPESSHHEKGPGQNEISFKYYDVVEAADNFVTFKSVVKTVAAKNGLFASFMPKPIEEKNGNGFHINLSLFKEGVNLFGDAHEHSQLAESFIAGVLRHAAEITAFTSPLTNSYARFGTFGAPEYVSWSHQNRSQLIRIPTSARRTDRRMELRSPDPACNPYIVFSLIISAGLSGIKDGIALPMPEDANMYSAGERISSDIERLPENLGEALEILDKSEFVRAKIGSGFVDKYLEFKKEEYDRILGCNNILKTEHDMYFLRT